MIGWNGLQGIHNRFEALVFELLSQQCPFTISGWVWHCCQWYQQWEGFWAFESAVPIYCKWGGGGGGVTLLSVIPAMPLPLMMWVPFESTLWVSPTMLSVIHLTQIHWDNLSSLPDQICYDIFLSLSLSLIFLPSISYTGCHHTRLHSWYISCTLWWYQQPSLVYKE